MGKTRHAAPGAVLLALALVLTSCNWAFPRFDAGGTGTNSEESTLTLANAGGLHEAWTTAALGTFRSEPVSTSSTVFVATFDGSTSRLRAYDLAGATGCSGTPKVCQPLWTSPLDQYAQPSLTGSTIFVAGEAFDAGGTSGCTGTPKVCQPLFRTAAPFITSVIVNDLVYATPAVTGATVLAVYDANGTNGCSGSPKVCAPLRTYQAACGATETCQALQPVVDGSRAFVGIGTHDDTNFTGRIAAFDLAGTTGCSGTPVVCQPLWLRTVGAPWNVVATGGRVFTAGAFTTLSGSPPNTFRFVALSGADGSVLGSTPTTTTALTELGVAGSSVDLAVGFDLVTYDASCTGTCAPLRTAPIGDLPNGPIVANGVLYSGSQTSLRLFDASGATGCSGTPKVCTPAATILLPVPLHLSSVQSGRVVFNGDTDQELHVFSL